jgi:hypothetical protein
LYRDFLPREALGGVCPVVLLERRLCRPRELDGKQISIGRFVGVEIRPVWVALRDILDSKLDRDDAIERFAASLPDDFRRGQRGLQFFRPSGHDAQQNHDGGSVQPDWHDLVSLQLIRVEQDIRRGVAQRGSRPFSTDSSALQGRENNRRVGRRRGSRWAG